MLLTGEPGAGKTRLLRELRHEAAGHGALVLYGVSDAVVSTPYQPLREWLEFLLRVCDPEALAEALGSEGGQLARLVPELEQLGISATEAGDAEADRYLLQSAATKLLTPARSRATAAAARRRPALGRHRDAAPAPPARTHRAGVAAARGRRVPRSRRGDQPSSPRRARRPLAPRRGEPARRSAVSAPRRSARSSRPRRTRRRVPSSARRSASSPTARRCWSASSGATCARAPGSRSRTAACG